MDIVYWLDIYHDANQTIAGELLEQTNARKIVNSDESELLSIITNVLMFMNVDSLQGELNAIGNPSEETVLYKYKKLLTKVLAQKRQYDAQTVSNVEQASARFPDKDVALVKTDHRALVDWTAVQEGLECVSHGTVTCLKAAQPLIAHFLAPSILHQQLKIFERDTYGYYKPMSGVFPLTLTSLLNEVGYVVRPGDLEKDLQPSYEKFIKEAFIESTNAEIRLRATKYSILPYIKPIEHVVLDPKEIDQRSVLFDGDVEVVLKTALSQKEPILPIVFLDTYTSESETIVTEDLPIRRYRFNPQGMGHAVSIVGHGACPKQSLAKKTCYLVRDSLKDENYAWVPALNLLKRSMVFIFIEKTEITYN